MEGREYRQGFGGLRRWVFISSRSDWRGRVGGGDPGGISRKGSIHSAGSAAEETGGAVSGGGLCLSGDCQWEALHSRSRDLVGLRHQGKPLGTYAGWNRTRCWVCWNVAASPDKRWASEGRRKARFTQRRGPNS